MLARGLYTRMLNGDVPDLEIGQYIDGAAYKARRRSRNAGLYEAMQNHTIKN